MLDTLTIRNVTSLSLNLRTIEYYQESSPPVKKWFGRSPPRPKQPSREDVLDGEVRSVGQHDFSIDIAPFSVVSTGSSHNTERPSNNTYSQLLRLTFFAGDRIGNFRIALPSIDRSSAGGVPIDTTSASIHGIYFSNGLLALFTTVKTNEWMKRLPDSTPLSSLSIPGTHNSPAHHKNLPSVRCQVVSVREQLDNGVRFLDVRLQVDNPSNKELHDLTLVHGSFKVCRSGPNRFHDLWIYDIGHFLEDNPSETIILSLKREGSVEATDSQLARRLYSHWLRERVFLKPGIPTLGEARGKVVLFRRFKLTDELRELYGSKSGINASQWPDNSPNFQAGQVQVQDYYSLSGSSEIETKIEYVQRHCERAAAQLSLEAENAVVSSRGSKKSQKSPLFVNFLSASNLRKRGCMLEAIAAKVNPAMLRYLCERHGVESAGHGPTGILVGDWMNWSLVTVVIGMNERLVQSAAPHATPDRR